MNHLHEFIDCASSGEIEFPDGTQYQYIKTVTDFIKSVSTKTICFYGGDAEDISRLSSVDELCRLPYDACWVEFSLGDGCTKKILSYLALEVNHAYVALVFTRIKKDRWIFMTAMAPELGKANSGKTTFSNARPSLDRELLQSVAHTFRAFLSALNCINVEKEEFLPSDKLQKARTRRGKTPLFSYWVLNLVRPKSAKSPELLGGTHASPRVHLRRGHPRQCASGKYIWVQPHIVGRGPGMVHKDYAVTVIQ